MARDFELEFAEQKFWDQDTIMYIEENGSPPGDCILQDKGEIAAFCQFIDEHKVLSYLEIGIWTGNLIMLLKKIFKFKLCAACDIGSARHLDQQINLSADIPFFEGNSLSPIYPNWRKRLGMIDLTFIDASHQYDELKRDFAIAKSFPHRFIAIAGIAGSKYTGPDVKRFWEELEGEKHQILIPNPNIDPDNAVLGIGIWGG